MSALVDSTNKMNTESHSTEEIVQKTENTEKVANVETENNEVEESKEEREKKLREHVASGKRFMRTSEFNKAADVLSIASQLAGELFGDDAEESFDPFFLYGQALLELGKVEDQVFNNAMSNIQTTEEGEQANNSIDEEKYGNPEKLTEEERDEIKAQVEDALTDSTEKSSESETTNTVDKETETTSESASVEKSGAVSEDTTTSENKEENNMEDGAEEDTESAEDVEMREGEGEEGEEGEGEDEADDDDEDESSMKISWEILESARRICEKKLDSLSDEADGIKKWSLNKADVLTSLGEHSIADGKADQALKDLQSAFELQSCYLESSSRILAQTSLLLGKAFRHDGQFEEAAVHFEKSKKTLMSKIEELKKTITSAVEDEKSSFEGEIKELENLLPEMDVYIDDSKASAEQTAKIKETLKKELESAANVLNGLTGEGGDAPEAKDITSMIRRPTKRPASTEPEEEAAKKTKSDEADSKTDEASTTDN